MFGLLVKTCEWCGERIVRNEGAKVFASWQYQPGRMVPIDLKGFVHQHVCLDELWQFVTDSMDGLM